MKIRAILAMLVLTGVVLADSDGYSDDYGSDHGSAYIYERERAEEQPRAFIQNGPIVMPDYGGPAVSSGSGSGQDFVGSTHTLRGSCYSAYGITSCY